ncbi:MAG TPA: sensor histidine kinase, partial [Galbitalea sp.]
MRYFDWRAWLGRLARLWRTSLLTRTVSITLVLSALAVTVIGAYISVSVGVNLFDSRRDQLLAQADRATNTVQTLFTATAEQGATTNIEGASDTAFGVVLQSSASLPGTRIAILRTPGQPGPHVPSDEATLPAGATVKLISPELRKRVASSTSGAGRVFWQSISIPTSNGSHPGMVIGSSVN